MANEKKSVSVHQGHRKRIKERYLKSGLDDFAPHEVLELILFHAIPQGDVNPVAHRLLDQFGSLSAVLEADYEDLITVDGVGHSVAVLLTMLPEVFRHYQLDKVKPEETYETMEKIVRFIRPRFTGVTVEQVYVMLFDNGMHMLGCHLVAEGTVNTVKPLNRKILNMVMRKNASCVVLAHNHPRGIAVPSEDDRWMTSMIAGSLETIDVPLIEHLIITEASCAPIIRREQGLLHASPKGVIDEDFYRSFYGNEGKI